MIQHMTSHMLATAAPGFSWVVLVTLVGVAAISTGMFWLLVRRETTRRQWVTLRQWGRNHRLRFANTQRLALPGVLERIPAPRPQVRLWLAGDDVQVLQLAPAHTANSAAHPLPTQAPMHWNIVVRAIKVDWPATALRPAHRDSSFLDLYSLGSFPSMISAERFLLLGVDSGVARRLAQSPLKTLLPQDVGLLLLGRHLLLDFSSRPFDPIELDRMLALAAQLVDFLPNPSESAGN